MVILLLHVDHTLMNTHSLFFLLGSFYPLETLELGQQPLSYDTNSPEWNDFTTRMDRAYWRFVKRVAQKELSRDPLCLFRPRTMEWLKEVMKRKQEGKINEVILYTRSSYMRSCRFARDVIHTCLGLSGEKDLIIDIIDGIRIPFYKEKEDVYWIYHDRMEEKKEEQYQNRIHVPFYDFATSFDRVAELYISSLEEERVSFDAVGEIVNFLYGSKESLKKNQKSQKDQKSQKNQKRVYDFLKERTGRTASNISLPPCDEGWISGQRWLERLDREEGWRKRYTIGVEDLENSFMVMK